MTPRHLLTVLDLSRTEIERIVQRASELRRLRGERTEVRTLPARVLAMIFEKSSTRTRVAFEAGIDQLGGHAIFLSPRDTQLGRGEPIEDTARVLSRMVDAVMIRTFEHERLERFASHATVPVINGLSDDYHPTQVLADIQTFIECRGPLEGRRVAWVGDGNNMCHSYINAAVRLGFELQVACPRGYQPSPEVVARGGESVHVGHDPRAAVAGSDLVVTDVWASMGQEAEDERRRQAFAGFQVDERLMALARPDALFMHCLPAHRGEEVSAAVIDGRHSVVWDEAENRLHAHKALLEFLILG